MLREFVFIWGARHATQLSMDVLLSAHNISSGRVEFFDGPPAALRFRGYQPPSLVHRELEALVGSRTPSILVVDVDLIIYKNVTVSEREELLSFAHAMWSKRSA